MKQYTQKKIEELIQMPKEITKGPRKEMDLTMGHFRNDMKLKSPDGQYDFSVYMRKNEMFQENFSIGLIFHPGDGSKDIHLLRCNGPHGPHEFFAHHDESHIHKANEENIREGLKEDKNVEITKEYATYDDALHFFLKKCNIVNADEYFNMERQLSLFED
jgi:hypothetical protein